MTIRRNFRQNCSNITYNCRRIFMSIFYINLLKLMSKELVFDVISTQMKQLIVGSH